MTTLAVGVIAAFEALGFRPLGRETQGRCSATQPSAFRAGICGGVAVPDEQLGRPVAVQPRLLGAAGAPSTTASAIHRMTWSSVPSSVALHPKTNPFGLLDRGNPHASCSNAGPCADVIIGYRA